MTTLDAVAGLFEDGQQIFIAGSSAEPTPIAVQIAQSTTASIRVTNSFVPGVNTRPLATIDNSIDETVIFPRGGELSGTERVHQKSLSYYGYNKFLDECRFDWAVAHVSAPDTNGRCSLGTSVEFMPTVLRNSERVLAVVNPAMPNLPGSPKLSLDECDEGVEVEFPLVTYDAGADDAVSNAIASHLIELIEDGATIQSGLGKVPNRLLNGLTDRRNLRFHSGMLSDGFVTLLNTSALDPDYTHVTCSALGSRSFYSALANIPNLKICGVEESHDPKNLQSLAGLVALNSALQVDISGQANLETVNGRPVSGVGGAPDFARAARHQTDGKSIIALPATARKGTESRIVVRFDDGTPVSLGRDDIDYVVTEFGVAQLAGRSPAERADALINIAAPQFRDELAAAWKETPHL